MTWRIAFCRWRGKCFGTASQLAAASAIYRATYVAPSPRIGRATKRRSRLTSCRRSLRAIDGYGELGDKLTAYALRLLALTFVRTGELIGATRDEIDLDGAAWIIPAARMKMRTEHVVPLSRQAVKALRELQAIGGGSRYVFPGRNPDKPISNNTMLFALYRLGYKGKMTGHGFRAVASTVLNERGFRADVIERQLAHCERNDIRGAYNRAEYLPERRKMMQQWADMVDALANGARVIPLQRRAGSGVARL